MRHAHAPVGLRHRAGEMQGRRRCEARLPRSWLRCSPTGRASGRACRPSAAAVMPPSLISFSDTPRRASFCALVSMSANGVDRLVDRRSAPCWRLRQFLQAVDVVVGEGLLDEHQLLPCACTIECVCARIVERQSAVGVGAQWCLRHRLAHRDVRSAISFSERLRADLAAVEVEAHSFWLHLSLPRRPARRSCFPSSHIGFTASRRGWLGDGRSMRFTPVARPVMVEHRHLHRGMHAPPFPASCRDAGP